jgi:hypothetical protein
MNKEIMEKKKAMEFLGSARGSYIISQALCKAIAVMENVPEPFKEPNNIDDMKYLRDNLFPVYKVVEQVNKQYAKEQIMNTISKKGGD